MLAFSDCLVVLEMGTTNIPSKDENMLSNYGRAILPNACALTHPGCPTQ